MTDKGKGILSYIFWIAALIFLLQKENSQTVKLHAAQSITLTVAYYILNIICGFIPVVGGILQLIVSIVYLVFFIMGLVKVCHEDQDQELPLIGKLIQAIFGKAING